MMKKNKRGNGLLIGGLPRTKTKIQRVAEEKGLYDNVPPCKLKKVTSHNLVQLSYPTEDHDPYNTTSQASGIVVSMYPYFPHRASRDGDPICDSYRLHVHDNAMIWCIADGCNWGLRPRQASIRAKDAFVGYLESKIGDCKNLKDLAVHIVNGLATSHETITQDKKDIFTAGTTTILGGGIFMYDDKEQKDWIACYGSIGDCKLFHFDFEEGIVYDLTAKSRAEVEDGKDPGGRIGPYVGDHGDPDLRNFNLQYKIIKEGDILIAVSDGVHDNLDPQISGNDPRDCDLDYDDWAQVPKEIKNKATEEYMCRMLKQLIFDCPSITPTLICRKIVEHVTNITSSGKQFLEQNPNSVLVGTDYKQFPGKMDHTTVVCMKIGMNDSNDAKGPQSLYPEVFPY